MIRKKHPFWFFSKILFVIVLCFLGNALVTEVVGQSYFKKNFIDSADNSLDLSNYLSTKVGIIPIPVLVTEPAVGFGGGLSLVYFHRDKKKMMTKDSYGFPPSISMLAGVGTVNGSFASIFGHQGSYLNDFIRYTGAIRYMDMNLAFYGSGVLEDDKYKFNMKGIFTFHELSFRANKSLPLFLGFNYMYFGSEVKFKDLEQDEELGNLQEDMNTAGLNFMIMWDSRDNIFTPNYGIFSAVDIGIYDKWLGGDRNYNNFGFRMYGFSDKWLKKTVFGFRGNVAYKWGDVPFYELPFINLRGIPALRYQNNLVNVLETEIRYAVWKRWSLIGFVGAGTASIKYDKEMFDNVHPAGGLGFRYLLAKQYGLHLGLDFAHGPEQFAWYLTFGSNWFR